jgi:glycosyltransferase involved in cell wall biosynthesis
MDPEVHILYNFVEGPWGGGNQFLKALRNYFRNNGVYTEFPNSADVIFFNSHHCLEAAAKIKKKYPNKIFIHRVDGPIFYTRGGEGKIIDEILFRGKSKRLDEIIFHANNAFADGTIFQSKWSRIMNYELGMKRTPNEIVIMNAPDPSIFNPKDTKEFEHKKVKLIAISWFTDIRKGFDIYKFLDESLDFNKYEMTFVGNSPIRFKNINWIKPVPSHEVARILKEHDIYITASRNDPCSNALIEALHCGLPAVAINDGGHPEILGEAGEVFEDEEGVIKAIEKIVQNFEHYRARITLPTLNSVGQKYYEFAKSIYDDYSEGNYRLKEIHFFNMSYIKFRIKNWIKNSSFRIKSWINDL